MAEELAKSKHKQYSVKKKLVLTFLTILIVTLSWTNVIDRHAKGYVDITIVQAGAAFLTARGLNAFLTTAKSVETGIGPMSFQPLQILDPVHDLVEHFSSLMKVSIVSLLIQKFLIEIASTTLFKYLLTGFAIASLILLCLNQPGLYKWCWKLLLMIGMLRFLFVAVVLLNAVVDEAFTRSATDVKQRDVEVLAAELERASRVDIPTEEERSSLHMEQDSLSKQLSQLPDQINETKKAIGALEFELQEIQDMIDVFPRRLVRSRDVPESLLIQEDVVRDDLQVHQENLRRLQSQQKITENRLEEIGIIIQGGYPKGWTHEWLHRLRTVVDIVRVTTLKDRAEQLVDGILALMALFFLRTVLLPVVFLYLLTKAFKWISTADPILWMGSIKKTR